jgi:hypothetical protein
VSIKNKKIEKEIRTYSEIIEMIGDASDDDAIAKYCYFSQHIIRKCRDYIKYILSLEEIDPEDIFNMLYNTRKFEVDYTDTYNYFDRMLVVSSYGEYWIEEDEENYINSFKKHKKYLHEILVITKKLYNER